jgi:putative ABC transport system permease protein
MPVIAVGPVMRALARRPASTVLLVFEVALGLAVSIESLLYVGALQRTEDVPLGLPVPALAVLTTESLSPRVPTAEENRGTAGREKDALRAVPGVRAAAFVRYGPHDPAAQPQVLGTIGSTPRLTAIWPLEGEAELSSVLGLRAYAGRLLNATDASEASGAVPVVISRTAASWLFYPPRAAVGQRLELRDGVGVVAGVAEHFLVQGPFQLRPSSMVLRIANPSEDRALGYVVRMRDAVTDQDVARLVSAVERVSPGRVVTGEALAARLYRLGGNAHGAYDVFRAMVAVIVTLVLLGTFATSWLSVAEQTRQIGIRRALGATRADVVAHFLVANLLTTALGAVTGVALAYAVNLVASRLEEDLLFSWPLACAGVLAFLVIGQLAAFIPALRGARVPPREACVAG